MRWNLSDNFHELSRTFAQLRNSYRPELHYMRGPGPKSHAKRAGIAMKSTAAGADVEPALKVAEARA
jgi:hypothetical protein